MMAAAKQSGPARVEGHADRLHRGERLHEPRSTTHRFAIGTNPGVVSDR
jgi:hypothetical protein